MTVTKTPVKKAASKRTAVPAPAAASVPSAALDTLTSSPIAGAKVVDYATGALAPHPANPQHRSDAGFEDLAERIRAEGQITEPLTIRLIDAPDTDSAQPLGEVLSGARRLAAAQLLGMVLVPVRVVDVDDATAHRMVLAANLDRLDFTEAEQADLVQGALDLGMSEKTLAEQLGKGKEWIARRRAIAKLTAPARQVLAENPSIADDLDVVAQIAEFSGDADAIEDLTETAEFSPNRLPHRLEYWRQEAAKDAFIARVEEGYRDAGIKLLTEPPLYDDPNVLQLSQLSGTADSHKSLDGVKHKDCPGHAVYSKARVIGGTGEGYNFAEMTWEYCTTWKTAGHYKIGSRNTAGATSGEQTDEQKAERRHLIETNKAAVAAEVVRRTWLTEFLSRDKLPADALVYVEEILYAGRSRGLSFAQANELLPASAGQSPAKATHRLVALAAGHVEQTMPKDYWRSTYDRDLYTRHLTFLQSWGYGLAPHEQDFVDEHSGTNA